MITSLRLGAKQTIRFRYTSDRPRGAESIELYEEYSCATQYTIKLPDSGKLGIIGSSSSQSQAKDSMLRRNSSESYADASCKIAVCGNIIAHISYCAVRTVCKNRSKIPRCIKNIKLIILVHITMWDSASCWTHMTHASVKSSIKLNRIKMLHNVVEAVCCRQTQDQTVQRSSGLEPVPIDCASHGLTASCQHGDEDHEDRRVEIDQSWNGGKLEQAAVPRFVRNI